MRRCQGIHSILFVLSVLSMCTTAYNTPIGVMILCTLNILTFVSIYGLRIVLNKEKRSVLIGRRLGGASRDRYAYCKSCDHLWCEVCFEQREQREGREVCSLDGAYHDRIILFLYGLLILNATVYLVLN